VPRAGSSRGLSNRAVRRRRGRRNARAAREAVTRVTKLGARGCGQLRVYERKLWADLLHPHRGPVSRRTLDTSRFPAKEPSPASSPLEPGLPLVLSNLTIVVRPRERIITPRNRDDPTRAVARLL